MALHYFVVDTETTGFDPNYHEIIEISIIDCTSLKQISRNIKAEYPERSNLQSLQIIGKTKFDIIKGNNQIDVINEVENFLTRDGLTPEHRCMIAHQANFDRNFLFSLWKKHKKEFPVSCWLDTKALAKLWFKKKGILKPKLTLKSALTLTSSPLYDGEHNAISDVRNTFIFWKESLEQNLDYIDLIKRIPHSLNENIKEEDENE